MKDKMLTALLVTAAVMLAACGSSTPLPSATPTPRPTPQPAGTITKFPLPNPNSDPEDITVGPDGNLWFTESVCSLGSFGFGCSSSQIGRLTSSGQITEFALPTADSEPLGIARGADGNLWFTEAIGNTIGRITPTGKVTEFPLPNPDSFPLEIAAGHDGNLWFTESGASKIGRITPTGQITEVPLPNSNLEPQSITAGPDGNLWFTECVPLPIGGPGSDCGNGQIGRITPAGQITEFSPFEDQTFAPTEITAGPDGNLWFTEEFSHVIGRITPAGGITEYLLSDPNVSTEAITTGPDGNLWFTECTADSSAYGCSISKIVRFTTSQQATEFPVPTPISVLSKIAAGPDGNLWFTGCIPDSTGYGCSSSSIGRIASGK